jgi:hypothetical protein
MWAGLLVAGCTEKPMDTGDFCPDESSTCREDEGEYEDEDAGSDEQAENQEDGDASKAECKEGDLEVCECSDTEYGERTCTAGKYGDCEACKVPETSLPRCVAGLYKGRFTGMYRSRTAYLLGIPVVEVLDADTDLDVEFELRRTDDGEFYTVAGGCFPVPGEETFVEGDPSYGHTFEMKGNVDCTTGVINFELRLIYLSMSWNQFGGWERIFAKGEMTGRFDPQTASFVGGKWNLREAKDYFDTSDPGGGGAFTATLVEETSALAVPGEQCFDVPFAEDLKPQPIPTPTPG